MIPIRSTSSGLLLALCVVGSFADDCDLQTGMCPIIIGEDDIDTRVDRPRGAVLLQVAKYAPEETSPEEQLAKYAMLKHVLSQSKESASIMKSIDQALDTNDNVAERKMLPEAEDAALLQTQTEASSQAAEDAPQLDDDEQAALAAQGPSGIKAWTVGGRKAKKAATTTHDLHRRHAISLMEAGGSTSKRQRASAEDDDEYETIQDTTEDDSEDESEAEEEEEVTDRRWGPKNSGKKVSLMMRDLKEANSEPLDESGYADLLDSGSKARMERFIERAAADLSLKIVDPGGLKGVVPFYSGDKGSQSFAALQEELLSTAEMADGWVVMKKRHAKHRHAGPLLLQTDETHQPEASLLQAAAASNSSSGAGAATTLSMLRRASSSAVRAVQKVPDLAVYLFGSRVFVILGAMCLALCLVCMDDRKHRGKGAHSYNPLNLSPEPPAVKEDPEVIANLKILRGTKDSPASFMK